MAYLLGFGWSLLEHTLVIVLLVTVVLLWRRKKTRSWLSRVQSVVWHRNADVCICTGPDGFVKDANTTFKTKFGWTKDEFLKVPLIEMVHPEDRRRTREHLKQMQGTGTVNSAVEFRHRFMRKDGRSCVVQWYSLPAWDLGVCIHVGRDITDLTRQIEELSAASRKAEIATQRKSEFLAVMSHEIRTPLSAIVGMCDLLLGTPLSSEQREHAGVIKHSSQSMLTLLSDILDFSRIESRHIQLAFQPFDLQAVLESTLDLVAHMAGDKQLEVAVRVAPDVPRVLLGDAMRLRQVLLNLLTNGIKFTAHGHVLAEVAVARARAPPPIQPVPPAPDNAPAAPYATLAHELRIRVSDTGIGVPREKRGELFLAFSQLDATRTQQYGGTGLGLSICRSLCEMMGGWIGLEDTDPAQAGAVFHCAVRVDRPAPDVAAAVLAGLAPGAAPDAALQHHTERAETRALAGRRVLLLLPDECVREALVQATRRAGADVVAVPSARRLLSALQATAGDGDGDGDAEAAPTGAGGAGAFDALVVDTADLAALDAVRRLRASDSPAAGLPAVLLAHRSRTSTPTAAPAFPAAVREALAGGLVQAVLAKPVKLSLLRRALVDALQLRSRVEAEVAAAVPRPDSAPGTGSDTGPGSGDAPSAAGPALSAAARQLRVLVADDVVMNRSIVSLQLARLGLTERVDAAGDGREALQAMLARDYDLVLMDVCMPEMDGLEATRRFRAQRPRPAGPVIVAMTARAQDSQRAECLQAGMDGCLHKPLVVGQLLPVLEDAARRRAGSRPAGEAPACDGSREESSPGPGLPRTGLAAGAGGGASPSSPRAEGAALAAAMADAAGSTQPSGSLSLDGSLPRTALSGAAPPPPASALAPAPAPAPAAPAESDLPDAATLAAEAAAAAGGQPALRDTDNLELAREAGLLGPVLDSFVSMAPRAVREARQHWAAGAWLEACKAVHRLKGASGNLGAMRLYELCRQLESQRSAPPPDTAQQLRGIDAELARVLEVLRTDWQ